MCSQWLLSWEMHYLISVCVSQRKIIGGAQPPEPPKVPPNDNMRMDQVPYNGGT